MVPNNIDKNYVKQSTIVKLGEVNNGYPFNYMHNFSIEKSVTWFALWAPSIGLMYGW